MIVISGGQTGADQGALYGAKAAGVETGGWAPLGWQTDRGPAPWLADYGLRELQGFRGYRPRTIANVHRATSLLWIGNPNSPGGRLTLETARQRKLVPLILEWPSQDPLWEDLVHVSFLQRWLALEDTTCWMVAGNRERINPGIQAYTEHLIRNTLAPLLELRDYEKALHGKLS